MLDEDNEAIEYQHAVIPDELKALRSCLRCSLIKTFEQFIDQGCENCDFLNMEGDSRRVQECTTSHYEGVIGLIEPQGSWVAKWQRIAQYQAGMYAIEVVGQLPADAVEYCLSTGIPYKVKNAK